MKRIIIHEMKECFSNMKMIKDVILVFIFCNVMVCKLVAQDNTILSTELKEGITYVPINKRESEVSKKYIELIKANWKISKIQFISYEEIPTFLQKGNFFLSFLVYEDGYRTSYGSSTRPADDFSRFSLALWTCNDRWFKDQPKKVTFMDNTFDIKYRITLGSVPLSPDFHLWSAHREIYKLDLSTEGHIEGWGEGFFLNCLQNIQRFSKPDPEIKKMRTPELKHLKDQTLFIPECILDKNALHDLGRKIDADKAFKNYRLNYQLISIDELNRKILTGNEFFYLYFIKGKTTHTFVYNAKTGKQVYYKERAAFVKVHFDNEDIEDVFKAVTEK